MGNASTPNFSVENPETGDIQGDWQRHARFAKGILQSFDVFLSQISVTQRSKWSAPPSTLAHTLTPVNLLVYLAVYLCTLSHSLCRQSHYVCGLSRGQTSCLSLGLSLGLCLSSVEQLVGRRGTDYLEGDHVYNKTYVHDMQIYLQNLDAQADGAVYCKFTVRCAPHDLSRVH